MKIQPVKDFSEVQSLRSKNIPIVAIDLGFSGRKPTTGYADSSQHPTGKAFKFSDAVKEAAKFSENKKEIVLILEAPLSGKFEDGNPVARGTFEEAANGTPPKNWNIGAGAAVALAALHFLIQLRDTLDTKTGTLHLVEGFISGANKPKTDPELSKKAADEQQHQLDAVCLLKGFSSDPKKSFIPIPKSPELLSTLKILIPGADSEAPLVLKPQSAPSAT